MKAIKNIGLIFLIFSAACAVLNFEGSELTHNPTFVFITFILSCVAYAIGDIFEDRGKSDDER